MRRMYGKTKFVSNVSDDEITITLSSISKWYFVPILTIYIIFTGMTSLAFITGFIVGKFEISAILVIITFFMIFFFCSSFYYMLWQIAGKEIIIVSDESITDIKQLFYYQKISVYNFNKVSKLRFYDHYERMAHPLGRAMIIFNYGKKTIYGENPIKIGVGINKEMALQIIEIIRDKFPKYCD